MQSAPRSISPQILVNNQPVFNQPVRMVSPKGIQVPTVHQHHPFQNTNYQQRTTLSVPLQQQQVIQGRQSIIGQQQHHTQQVIIPQQQQEVRRRTIITSPQRSTTIQSSQVLPPNVQQMMSSGGQQQQQRPSMYQSSQTRKTQITTQQQEARTQVIKEVEKVIEKPVYYEKIVEKNTEADYSSFTSKIEILEKDNKYYQNLLKQHRENELNLSKQLDELKIKFSQLQNNQEVKVVEKIVHQTVEVDKIVPIDKESIKEYHYDHLQEIDQLRVKYDNLEEKYINLGADYAILQQEFVNKFGHQSSKGNYQQTHTISINQSPQQQYSISRQSNIVQQKISSHQQSQQNDQQFNEKQVQQQPIQEIKEQPQKSQQSQEQQQQKQTQYQQQPIKVNVSQQQQQPAVVPQQQQQRGNIHHQQVFHHSQQQLAQQDMRNQAQNMSQQMQQQPQQIFKIPQQQQQQQFVPKQAPQQFQQPQQFSQTMSPQQKQGLRIAQELIGQPINTQQQQPRQQIPQQQFYQTKEFTDETSEHYPWHLVKEYVLTNYVSLEYTEFQSENPIFGQMDIYRMNPYVKFIGKKTVQTDLSFQSAHGCIDSNNIYYDEDLFLYRVYDNAFLNGEFQGLKNFINFKLTSKSNQIVNQKNNEENTQKQFGYLSPQYLELVKNICMFNNMSQDQIIQECINSFEIQKQEIFSLGILLLEACTLINGYKFYDFINCTINFDMIRECLNFVERVYCKKTRAFIQMCLQQNQNTRATLSELVELFADSNVIGYSQGTLQFSIPEYNFQLKNEQKRPQIYNHQKQKNYINSLKSNINSNFIQQKRESLIQQESPVQSIKHFQKKVNNAQQQQQYFSVNEFNPINEIKSTRVNTNTSEILSNVQQIRQQQNQQEQQQVLKTQTDRQIAQQNNDILQLSESNINVLKSPQQLEKKKKINFKNDFISPQNLDQNQNKKNFVNQKIPLDSNYTYNQNQGQNQNQNRTQQQNQTQKDCNKNYKNDQDNKNKKEAIGALRDVRSRRSKSKKNKNSISVSAQNLSQNYYSYQFENQQTPNVLYQHQKLNLENGNNIKQDLKLKI
ncbi:Protein kinase-like domain [Pseudocohnilembus persalinus]|uniref:Protein kinase-like domain n=1 Tax=Pseudocohnilembus persalinus TaxID=266149 RepID=A0A0V0R6K7_PSEPJ|nr:Protein kinase-like domain [Pseudocohnilembus persalinus]|eukprot:KRX09984.1 Protein kinase-like domain [Pseudocohnilembus persalinus]